MSTRWEKGIEAYASQFGIEPEAVHEHMTNLVGERMAVEAIESPPAPGRMTSCRRATAA